MPIPVKRFLNREPLPVLPRVTYQCCPNKQQMGWCPYCFSSAVLFKLSRGFKACCRCWDTGYNLRQSELRLYKQVLQNLLSQNLLSD